MIHWLTPTATCCRGSAAVGSGALSEVIGRKKTFAIALVAAFFSTVIVFWFLTDLWQPCRSAGSRPAIAF